MTTPQSSLPKIPEIPRNLFGKPILRTPENETEEHRKATWLDLFFDLFFVAGIGTISHGFAHDFGHRSRILMGQTILYITAVRRLWRSITYFFERYKTQGLTKRFFMFVQMFLIAGIVLTITGGIDAAQIFFVIYGIAKGCLAGMYIRANTGHKDPIYCKNNRLQIYGNNIVLIASLASILLPSTRTSGVLILALALELLVPYIGRSTIKYIAPSFETDTYSERFGLFIIIVLGESIVGAISSVTWDHLNLGSLSLIAAAILLSFTHRWIYFEYVSQAHIRKEKILSRSYLHLPLTIAFTLISATIIYIVEYSEIGSSHIPIMVLIASCIIVMATVIRFERITGPYNTLIPKKNTFTRHMVVPIIIMIIFLFDWGLTPQITLWGVALATIIPIIMRVSIVIREYRKQQSNNQ